MTFSPGHAAVQRPSSEDGIYDLRMARFMTAPEKDRLIAELRGHGWTLKRIGQEIGMTAAGVSAALKRIPQGRSARDPRVG